MRPKDLSGGPMVKAIRAGLGLSVLATILVSTAQAQQRTFVSGGGSDANPCSRAAPCRTFGQAISLTNPGGEVIVLDSAGYGAVIIAKSISLISPPGIYAGISVFSGDGVDITAGSSDVIILRGLTINNQGSNGSGISFGAGATLRVDRCTVNGFSQGAGLDIGSDALFTPRLEVKDSIMTGNSFGIRASNLNGLILVVIDSTQLNGNDTGVRAGRLSRMTIRNSVASNNATVGLFALTGSADPAELDVENCVVASNPGVGIAAQSLSSGVATVRVSNSTLIGNGIGLDNNGSPARILSRGNNTVEGNIFDTAGTIGSYSAK